MNAAERAQRLVPALSRVFVRFASKKQGGSTSNGRDSCPKFLGLKAGGGEVRACGGPTHAAAAAGCAAGPWSRGCAARAHAVA